MSDEPVLQVNPVGLDTSIGFVGLGVMGSGMAQSLLRKGFRLSAHSRNPASASALVELGASLDTLAEVAQRARIILLSLPETIDVEAVLLGPGGLADGLPPGSCVIDTSTISPDGARRFASVLASKGVAFLDAPVSGGQEAAIRGTLSCMVGGPRQAFEACESVFAAISSRCVHVGEVGSGQITKACNQIAVAASLLGVAEALALAARHHVDLETVRTVLLGGAARSFSLEKHGERIINGAFEPGFRAALMRKDLRLALDSGRQNGNFMPVTATATQLLDVLCNQGGADLDWSALGRLIAELSGALPTGREQGGSNAIQVERPV